MKTITYTELTAWIRKQPLDRAINMSESTIAAECGCIMIQFAKDNGIDCSSVGFTHFYNAPAETGLVLSKLDECGRALIIKCFHIDTRTYADVIPLL